MGCAVLSDDRTRLLFWCAEKVLDRGEKFELLVDRTDKLNKQSVRFERSSTQLRKSMWRRNMKLWALLVIAGLVSCC